MKSSAINIDEVRELTAHEVNLTHWLLEHGNNDAHKFIDHLSVARVCSRCSCGCASINLSIADKRPKTFGLGVLSHFQWSDAKGHLFGIFVFEQDDLLAGIDVYSIDGQSVPSTLPSVAALAPFGTPISG